MRKERNQLKTLDFDFDLGLYRHQKREIMT